MSARWIPYLTIGDNIWIVDYGSEYFYSKAKIVDIQPKKQRPLQICKWKSTNAYDNLKCPPEHTYHPWISTDEILCTYYNPSTALTHTLPNQKYIIECTHFRYVPYGKQLGVQLISIQTDKLNVIQYPKDLMATNNGFISNPKQTKLYLFGGCFQIFAVLDLITYQWNVSSLGVINDPPLQITRMNIPRIMDPKTYFINDTEFHSYGMVQEYMKTYYIHVVFNINKQRFQTIFKLLDDQINGPKGAFIYIKSCNQLMVFGKRDVWNFYQQHKTWYINEEIKMFPKILDIKRVSIYCVFDYIVVLCDKSKQEIWCYHLLTNTWYQSMRQECFHFFSNPLHINMDGFLRVKWGTLRLVNIFSILPKELVMVHGEYIGCFVAQYIRSNFNRKHVPLELCDFIISYFSIFSKVI
eukprot:80064_1